VAGDGVPGTELRYGALIAESAGSQRETALRFFGQRRDALSAGP